MIETLDQNPFEKITNASFQFREDIVYDTDAPSTIRRPEISRDNIQEWNSYFVEVYNLGAVVSHLKQKQSVIKELSLELTDSFGLRFFEESIPEGSGLSTEYLYFFPQGTVKMAEVHSKYEAVAIATMQTEWLLKPFLCIPIRAIIDHE